MSVYDVIGDEPVVEVSVLFPYRGLFFWDADAEVRLRDSAAFRGWDIGVQDAVLVWGRGSRLAERDHKYAADVWDALGDLAQLSDDDLLVVLDSLIVPGTRGVGGSVSWETSGPDMFIVDSTLTEVLSVPVRLSADEIVAAIYDMCGEREVFHYTVAGAEGVVVRDAFTVADDVFFASRDDGTVEVPVEDKISEADEVVSVPVPVVELVSPIPVVPVPVVVVNDGLVTLNVEFPFVAWFRWDKSSEALFLGNGTVRRWGRYKTAEVVLALNSSRAFRKRKVVKQLSVLWDVLGSVRISGAGQGSFGLTDAEKCLVRDLLVVPGTRGVKGDVGFEDEVNGEFRFIADSALTRTVQVPYQGSEVEYSHILRSMFGTGNFRFTVVN